MKVKMLRVRDNHVFIDRIEIRTSFPKRIRERISRWNERLEKQVARKLGVRLFN